MKKKQIFLLVILAFLFGLTGCSEKIEETTSVNMESIPDVIESEIESPSEGVYPLESHEPEEYPVEEFFLESETEENKELDLESLKKLKYVMEILAGAGNDYPSYDYDLSFVHSVYSGEEHALSSFLTFTYDCMEEPEGGYSDEDGLLALYSAEQVQEAMNSLTGHPVDISSVERDGMIEVDQLWGDGFGIECDNWNTEYIGNNTWKVLVDAYSMYLGGLCYKTAELTFTVIEKSDSIFDGYSIVEVEAGPPDIPEWAQAYLDYMQTWWYFELLEDISVLECRLIYLDNDDIPELYIGYMLLSYYDGQVIEIEPGNRYYSEYRYIPQSGLLIDERDWSHLFETGNAGNAVFRLVNGECNIIANGEIWAEYTEDELKEEMLEYYWDGERVSKEEYDRKVNEVFDDSKAVYVADEEKMDVNSIIRYLSSL